MPAPIPVVDVNPSVTVKEKELATRERMKFRVKGSCTISCSSSCRSQAALSKGTSVNLVPKGSGKSHTTG